MISLRRLCWGLCVAACTLAAATGASAEVLTGETFGEELFPQVAAPEAAAVAPEPEIKLMPDGWNGMISCPNIITAYEQAEGVEGTILIDMMNHLSEGVNIVHMMPGECADFSGACSCLMMEYQNFYTCVVDASKLKFFDSIKKLQECWDDFLYGRTQCRNNFCQMTSWW